MCTKKTPDKVIADNGYYYKCNGSSWVSISITDGLGECTADNAYRKTGEIYVFAGGAYYCNTSKWEHAYASQVLGACNSDRKAEIGMVGDTAYICNGEKDWLLAAGLENEYGLCTDNTTRITFNGEKYGCVGESGIYRWRAEDDLDQTLGFCNGSGLQIKTYNNLEYVCSRKHDAWFTGKFDEMFELCSSALYGTEITFQGETYYCGDGTFTAGERRNFWHQLGSLEKEIGVCTKDKVGESASASSLTCTCKYNPGDPQNNWPYSYFWQCD
jgi:hypothetical protein